MYNSDLKIPIAVYDVEDKQMVMLFDSMNSCSIYIFDKCINRLGGYASKKIKCRKNRFNRTICFRYANKAQVELLGDLKVMVLDERFMQPGREKILSGFVGLEDLGIARGRY
jgi:hypothetical protein